MMIALWNIGLKEKLKNGKLVAVFTWQIPPAV
ncbi:MAG: hypothetical protein JWO06_90 [Bacteroidota bacterium]|nr:hypothetical protein [Bacteroidota bacterium]